MIKRDLYKKIKPYLKSKEAIIITGMRRVGKTTLLNHIYSQIKSKNKLFIDLENPIDQKLFEENDYKNIKKSLISMGLDFQKKVYLFLDEIQSVKTMPSVVKYFIDHYKVKFFLTGSASFYLKNLFSESLAGRKYIFELFPFNFNEFLKAKKIKIKFNTNITKPIFEKLSNLYKEYLEFGGFPDVIFKKTKKEKKKSLEDVFTSYFQMEVKQLSDFKKINKFRDLMLLLLERIGNKLDVQKLSQELGISRSIIYDYLSFLEDTYFIKLIRPFSKSRDVEIRSVPKIYVCDSGLANNLGQISRGSLFEQAVFQSLRIKGELNYYQRKSGAEIDFILNKEKAYEVKLTPVKSDLIKFKNLSRKINIKHLKIVCLNYSSLPLTIYGFEL
ncbi:hypothetical protein CL633_02330 [bacterium]|nr:hypothetical protein [bacterium]|tara:strand:- start:2112 stop:3269 length:1158 start_codon:yes stop_codon:yes gene_type:complete